MTAWLDQVENLLRQMTTVEKAELLLTVVRDLPGDHPGIERDPDICGGEPRIVRTRIPVWTIEQATRLGMEDLEILRAYPTLTPSDLLNARLYAQVHPEEIDRQIRDNEAA